MNKTLLATTLALSLGFGVGAIAQQAPVGGPDAKGNAPIKRGHTINDGSAKPGANSFTEGEARTHILHSGYTDVSALTKGQDGVWRGTATRNGAQVSVALDFKGNVSQAEASGGGQGGAMGVAPAASMDLSSTGAGMGSGGMGMGMGASGGGAAATGSVMRHHHIHHRRHHHGRGHCANPGPNGVACSGVDTTGKGISDREQNAMQAGAHP